MKALHNHSQHLLPHSLILVALLLLGFVASGSAAEKLVISLQEIDCQSCGIAVAELLERQEGVSNATFDRDLAEIAVEVGDGSPPADTLLQQIRLAGYKAVLGAGEGRYLESLEFPAGTDFAWISRAGEAVRVEDHLAPGKVTVVDYYAVWCGPCREVDAEMKRILSESDDVALRKINVVDWSSPIARQELRNVSALPYVEVFDVKGKRVASIAGLDLERLRKAIEKGRSK